MGFTYGFYNYSSDDPSDDLKEYDALQFGQIFDGVITDGVFQGFGNRFNQSVSNADNTMIIHSGRGWFLHTWVYNDGDYMVVLPAPESNSYRYDAIVFDIDNDSRHNEIKVISGRSSSDNPVKPDLVHTNTHWQFPICYVKRRPGVTQLAIADVENMIGSSTCPWVTGSTLTYDISQYTQNWQNEFTAWMTTKTSEYNSWFSGLEDSLDENVAAALLAKIDRLGIYVEKTMAISLTDSVSVTLNSPYISDGCFLRVTTNKVNVHYSGIVQDGNNVTITFPPYVPAAGETNIPLNIKVRVYITVPEED